jgi:glycosyltransferase involved in cell wall biosynthesis
MKISVVLATYNHAPFLRRCIESVLEQTHRELELIIVDDGSTDDSGVVVAEIARADNRIKLHTLEQNKGTNAAFEIGLAQATGNLLYAAASDDFLIDGEFFTHAVEALRSQRSAAGVFARAKVVDQDDLHELWTMGSAPKVGINTAENSLRAFFDSQIFIPGASAIWRLDLIRRAGGLDGTLGPQSDYFLNHALPAMADGVVFLDRTVTAVRASANSYSSRVTDDDFFRRHALVESKLRALSAASRIPHSTVRSWRFAVVNARLSMTRQRALYDAVRAASTDIGEWERSSIPTQFWDFLNRTSHEMELLSDDLDRRSASAFATFDLLAGPLEQ